MYRFKEARNKYTHIQDGELDFGKIISDGRNKLLLPKKDDKIFLSFYKRASSFAGNSVGLARAKKFMAFVYNEIEYDEREKDIWDTDGKMVVKLTDVILKKLAVCKEHTALVGMCLVNEGSRVVFGKGLQINIDDRTWEFWGDPYPHMWLKIYSSTGNLYYLSVSNNWLVNPRSNSKEVEEAIKHLKRK